MKNSVDQSAFDEMAKSYDDVFTNSKIGKAQRDLVWQYLEESGMHCSSKSVLELNAGTGFDAEYLSKKGHQVLATDGSSEMVKIIENRNIDNVSSIECRLQELATKLPKSNYDVIFSNFGGLNCLNPDELKTFFKDTIEASKNDAELRLVIMSSACLWEFNYFCLTLRWNKLFRRRKRSGVVFKSDSGSDRIYYYSPRRIKKLAKDFKVTSVRPVGFMIPPSYLENYFSKRPNFLKKLINIDKKLSKKSWLGNLSDHYYIELKRR